MSNETTSPTIIDSHVHALPPQVMKVYRDWLVRERPVIEGPPHLWASSAFERPDEQVAALDAAGITAALITFSNNAPGAMHRTALALKLSGGPEMVRQVNDQIVAWAQASQGRLIPTAFIEPRFGPDAVKELERVVHQLKVPAISMLTSYQGPGQPLRFLDHPMFLPVLELAAELKIPVFIHASARFNAFGEGEPALSQLGAAYLKGGLAIPLESMLCLVRLIVSGIFDRLPDLRVVFGQNGGFFPFMLGRFDVIYDVVIAGMQQSGADMPVESKQLPGLFRRLRDYVGHVYVDTHTMDQAAILCALESLGPDRILYGSDFPVTPASVGRQSALEMIQALPVDENVKAGLLGRNAMALLGLDRL